YPPSRQEKSTDQPPCFFFALFQIEFNVKNSQGKIPMDGRVHIWFEFRRQLYYKLAWQGGWLVAVPPQNTSRSCPCCGHVSADNRQTQARFECVGCGYENNTDVVGAINILRAGHAHCACEVSGAAMPPAAGTHRSDSFRL